MSLPMSRWYSAFVKTLSRKVGNEARSSTNSVETAAAASFLRQATSIAEMVRSITTPPAGMPSMAEQISAMPTWAVSVGKNWVLNYDRGEMVVPDFSSAPKSPGMPQSSITIISGGAKWYARSWVDSPALMLFSDLILWPGV